jgi:hypothetical protein
MILRNIIISSVFIACNAHALKIDSADAKDIAYCSGVLLFLGHIIENDGEFKSGSEYKKNSEKMIALSSSVLGSIESQKIMDMGIKRMQDLVYEGARRKSQSPVNRCEATYIKFKNLL